MANLAKSLMPIEFAKNPWVESSRLFPPPEPVVGCWWGLKDAPGLALKATPLPDPHVEKIYV